MPWKGKDTTEQVSRAMQTLLPLQIKEREREVWYFHLQNKQKNKKKCKNVQEYTKCIFVLKFF